MTIHIILNVLFFQACWIVTIYGASTGQQWLGPMVVAAWLIFHLSWSSRAPMWEGVLLSIGAAFGFVLESAFALGGVWSHSQDYVTVAEVPLWLLRLWVAFTATFAHSLRWIQKFMVLGVILGAIFGPLSYVAAGHFGAIVVGGMDAIAMLSVGYAVSTPLLANIAAWLLPEKRLRLAEGRS